MNQPARVLSPVLSPASARSVMERIATQLGRAVQGKEPQTQLVVTCLVSGGHVLLEDVPGVGKTTLAEALARACGLSFARVQFTADLMPADILGAQVFHAQTATFQFRPGPLFRQLVLADELNRAPPRTQSALLEAMAQGQVSLDGATYPLPAPFIVVATQNPVDFSGTYPLPDSQLDRFMVRMSLGHPAPDVEARLLATRGSTPPLDVVETVTGPEEVASLRTLAAELKLDGTVADYVVRLAKATREHGDIERGASTRAVLALGAAARAQALWDSRDFVTPGDVRAVLVPCWAHRVLLRSAVQGVTARDEAAHLLEELARKVPAPR
ncbi:AAA domain-containing protein [Pyxidicoccus fallax]|uniref:AAA domain-containing protein n=1 Tax=Pyxidicoccus fallax TaxID=394095 RepID=A0A848LKP3_9BACT|nr:AAA family ATPase [Pyxidicoccus fallax]NMO18270.1 AAA domain-containing protein [Pyxidicoccus fallax]NPC82403.1 AAA domain-containing protein [Pyxidicoccus fallax]